MISARDPSKVPSKLEFAYLDPTIKYAAVRGELVKVKVEKEEPFTKKVCVKDEIVVSYIAAGVSANVFPNGI
jgi:hypothetical protein